MFTRHDIGFTSLIYPESEGLEPTATGYHDLKLLITCLEQCLIMLFNYL